MRQIIPWGRSTLLALSLLLSLPLALAACGGAAGGAAGGPPPAEPAAESPEAASFPVTVTGDGGPVTLERRPGRIVSLSATATEMLFAIGAGDQVVAVDDHSNYPPQAPRTELSGFQPNVEAVVAYEPDLVVAAQDPGGLLDGLAAAGVPALLLGPAATLADTYAQVEQLGTATGHRDAAGRLAADLADRIDAVVAAAARGERRLTYYHELDPTLFTVSSATFVGELYGLLGLESVADAAAGAAGSPYPQLSAEYLLEADPDLILLADTRCCGVTAASLADRPGWERLTAVRTGAVVELDDDVASRWGPRVADLLAAVADAVAGLDEGGR